MSDIFLSYAREDLPVAVKLAKALEANGWSVWWDSRIPAGKTFDEVIETQLGCAKCVIVLWSAQSVQSRWVRTEANEGSRRGILIPVLIENVEIPLAFRLVQTSDLREWKSSELDLRFKKLAVDVAMVIDRSSTGPLALKQANQSVISPRRSRSLGLAVFAAVCALALVIGAVWFGQRWHDKWKPEPRPVSMFHVSSTGYLLVDDFAAKAHGLHKLFDQRNLEFRYEQGELRLIAKSAGILPVLYSSSITAQDFRANFSFRIPAKQAGGIYGLIFRCDHDADRILDSYVLLGISPDERKVHLWTFLDRAWDSIKTKDLPMAVTLHLSETNHVRLDVIGSMVRVFINDLEVAYFENLKLVESGMLGLFISTKDNAGGSVLFSHLDVYPEVPAH